MTVTPFMTCADVSGAPANPGVAWRAVAVEGGWSTLTDRFDDEYVHRPPYTRPTQNNIELNNGFYRLKGEN
jgi:hypothetical protein